MQNKFSKAMFDESNKTETEKGANAFKSTKDSLVDLFGTIGSLRSREIEEIENKFAKAYKEDPLTAMRMAFYARNIRGGLGERRTFRIILRWLAENYPEHLTKNIRLIPEFGRWDDMYSLVGTNLEQEMWHAVVEQLSRDLNSLKNEGEPVSLLGKWLKSENASSAETRRLGRLTAKRLCIAPKYYRKILSDLRARIRVVEKDMSSNKWEDIEFADVPSKAMMNYRNAFATRQPERFEEFLNSLEEGKEKINAEAVFPYEILERARMRAEYRPGSFDAYFIMEEDAVLEAQWKALPNYVTKPANFIVMADTSGSMMGRPMATSISLAVYFAERNTGVFHNQFMTFSSRPQFVNLEGDSLAEKVSGIESIVDTTDLERAFREILELAVVNSVPKQDMPKSLIVISDGEIDRFTLNRSNWSFLSKMEEEFSNEGYDLPKVVMWNVASRGDRFIDTVNNPNIQFISGSSPSSFKALITGQNFTAEELMYETLNDDMYKMIQI